MKLLSQNKTRTLPTLVVLLLAAWYFYRLTQQVGTERIEITSNGAVVGVLEANKSGEAELRLMGKNGEVMTITPAGITARNDQGVAFTLQNRPSGDGAYGPGLTLFDGVGGAENRAALYLSKGSPFLTFSSYHSIGENSRRATTNLLMHGTSETAFLEVQDKDGNVTWKSYDER